MRLTTFIYRLGSLARKFEMIKVNNLENLRRDMIIWELLCGQWETQSKYTLRE